MIANSLKWTFQPDPSQFLLIAGPCVVEDKILTLEIAEELSALALEFGLPLVFKASFKKANRTSATSFTGIGDLEALEILQDIGSSTGLPLLTDIHERNDADLAAEFVNVLQIPAFLCRQTDLLVAAGRTGKIVNIKKGQFMSPQAMGFAIEKVKQTGNGRVWLTERGTTFGYQDLVVDFRSIPAMQDHGVPVIVDCTHSLQRPNQPAGITGGQPDLIEIIARAAVAVGADGLFIETHPSPRDAKSDGENMLPLSQLRSLLKTLTALRKAIV